MRSVTGINIPNETRYFVPLGTDWELRQIPMKASVAISDGCAIGVEISSNTTTWYATKMPATNASGGNFIGILAEKISSTDDDYATAGKLKLVSIPKSKTATAKFLVWAGTFTAVDINKVVNFHSDSLSLAVDTQGLGAVITGYIDATHWICKFTVPDTVTA